jgi:hypothetical protein
MTRTNTSLDLVVLALVFLLANEHGLVPEFEMSTSSICGSGDHPHRPTYSTLSFTVDGIAAGMKVTALHLYEENASIHASWGDAVLAARGANKKVTTLHLDPTKYVRRGASSFTARGLADLYGAARALLLGPLLALQGRRPPPGLASLPDAICLMMLAYLPARDVCRAGVACRSLYQVTDVSSTGGLRSYRYASPPRVLSLPLMQVHRSDELWLPLLEAMQVKAPYLPCSTLTHLSYFTASSLVIR